MRRIIERSRRYQDDRGAVIPIIALSLVVLITMTAFSIDLGRQMVRRREAQAAADALSLDLSRQLDGRQASDITSDPKWAQTISASAQRNNFPVAGFSEVLGNWVIDPNTNVGSFVPCGCSNAVRPNAVQVTATDVVNFYFAPVIGISNGHVTRSATASDQGRSLAELGSVFAGFQYYQEPGFSAAYNLAAELRTKVLNATIASQFGIAASFPTGIGLDALSYKGISNGNVRLGDLAAAAGFGSTQDMLNANMSARDLLNAEATALRNSSDPNDVAAGNKIATFAGSASTSSTMRLGDMIDVTQGSGNNIADYHINALSLITGSGELINGKNFFSTTVDHGIPGVPPLNVRVSVIEPPQFKDGLQGEAGPSTSQIRFATSIPITLNLGGSFGSLAATVPIVVEAARATSTFDRIQCATPSTSTATDLKVVTNGINVQIGNITDAALQDASTLAVTGGSILHGSLSLPLIGSVNLDAVTNVNVSRTFKGNATYTGDLAANAGVLGATETHTFLGQTDPTNPASWRYQGGVASNTNMSTTVFNAITLGAGAPTGLQAALQNALVTQLGSLDSQFLDPMLSSLGIAIAGADGKIHNVSCGPHLVT
jgi:uncharacterized membrane protein